MHPEPLELWAGFEIKGLLDWLASWWALVLFLEDAWMMLQLPAFPNRQGFAWDGIPGAA